MSKTAIVILSNPNQNSEESLGRLFNALVIANDLKQRNETVLVFFQGTGSRWINELQKSEHPAFGLFNSIKDKVAGVSNACAHVFGAADDVIKVGVTMLSEFEIPGIGGATSLAKYVQDGYAIITF